MGTIFRRYKSKSRDLDYAQSELGDLVFISLPEEGDELAVDESFADVESVKAVSIYIAL